MHRKHLQRFSRELKNLEAYEELEKLVRRGIAYHHAGITSHTHTCLSPYS
jgi:replicative superfamily II helicase